MKKFKINIDIYDCELTVIANPTDDQANDTIKDLYDEEGSWVVGLPGYTMQSGTTLLVGFDSTRPSQGIVAHEALHVVIGIMNHIDPSKLWSHSEEPMCYLMEWIVDQINKGLRKK